MQSGAYKFLISFNYASMVKRLRINTDAIKWVASNCDLCDQRDKPSFQKYLIGNAVARTFNVLPNSKLVLLRKQLLTVL